METEQRYQAILSYLFSQFPQYQRIGAGAYKSGLEGILALDKLLEQPHKRFKTIHVAGTNGKGSVSHMLAAVLQQSGYKVGLYTSPHLIDFRERIRINGAMIPQKGVLKFVERHKAYLDEYRPSFFEITTAMAFDYFAGQKVDMAVIETGLGGRLDATNVIEPVLSIITNIGMDHCEYLGNTLASIAAEKAGIIKARTPVVIGERDPQTDSVFLQKAEDLAAPIFFAQDGFKVQESIQEDDCQRFIVIEEGGEPQEYCSDLRGWYQQKNLPAVLMAAKLLKINSKAIREGIRNAAQTTRLRGRWESISQKPEVIVDAAHNAHGMKCAVAQLHKRDYRRLHFILGVVVEKDLDSILALLPQDALYYFTQAQIPRALDAHILADCCRKAGLHGQVVERVQEAIAVAKTRAHPQDLVFVGGSIFVAAEALGSG